MDSAEVATLTLSYLLLLKSKKVRVEQGQILAKIESEVSESKLPFISNKFVEVYVDGVEVKSNKNSSSSTAEASSKEEDNLVAVTLVLKSLLKARLPKSLTATLQ